MAHPLQELCVTYGKVVSSLTVEQATALLTALEYRVVTAEEWRLVAEVVRTARAVTHLRDQGEASRKLNDELSYAIDQLDGEDHG
jgi:anthranilate phosphoribosyltransferase